MTRDERIAFIRTEAAEKRSAGMIGVTAGVTRNVIIGLGKRAKPKVQFIATTRQPGGGRKPRSLVPARPRAPRVPPAHAALLIEAEPQVIEEFDFAGALTTLLQVGRHECHFPMFTDAMIRETLEPSSLPYCGAAVEGDGEYCEYHRQRMYVAPLPKRLNNLVKSHGWNRNTR